MSADSGRGSQGGAGPGALSALLQEIASAPQVEAGAWEAALRPGAAFGKFELVREIGRGGFGVVWEARDLELGRSVAFKAVRAGGHVGLREERLLREAEAAARLTHPNIVTLHDLGRAAPGPYLVLELLRGQSLQERLSQGRLSLREAVRVITEIARGVAHAHGQGVVHRDLKPGNVFLCHDGQVKVLDFGLAHAFGQRRQEGGTPAYMAPEQWQGAPEDERTDVFALGVILFELLTGEVPFADERALRSTGAAPALEVPDLPGLATLLARMLEKHPVARPRDGSEVAEALRAFQAQLDRTTSSASAPVTVTRRPRLRLAGLVAAGVALGALAAGGVAWWRSHAAPMPVADADGRISVAVADFANETRDPDLDGLSVLLTTALEQSKVLRVVTRGALADALRRLGQGSLDRIDEGLARKAGVEAGVRALLLASVRKLDDVYAVELRAVDPRRDEYLFTVREQTTGKKGMLDVIDRLSERTRERLREPAREVAAGQVKVAEATTASLEAWHHYFEGLKEEDAVHLTPAIDAYRKAVAADPTFALANYKVAFLGLLVSAPLAERKAAMEAAVRGKDRVPLKERLLIEAWAAFMAGRSEEAHAIYARAAEAFPTDKEVLYATGTLYHTEMRWPEARPWLEKVVAIDPKFWPAFDELGGILFVHGTKEAYLALTRRYLAVAPPGPKATLALAVERALTGHLEEAAEATRRLLEEDQSRYFIEGAIGNLFFLGLLDEAEQRLRKLEVEAASSASRAAASFGLVIALDLQGRRREALAQLERSERRPQQRAGFLYHFLMDDPDPRPCVEAGREFVRLSEANGEPPAWRSWVAFGMAYLGQREEATRIAVHLKPEDGLELYRAIATWRGGDLAGALSQLRALDRDMDTPKRIVVSWYHARVAFAAGQWAEAIAAGEEAEPKVWGTWRSWGVPLLLLERAQAYGRLGQREKAIAVIDRLLGWWKKADPDLPRLAQARAIKARLVAAGPAAPAGSASGARP